MMKMAYILLDCNFHTLIEFNNSKTFAKRIFV